MAYDFLNITTQTAQLQDQEEMMQYMQQALQAKQDAELNDLEEVDDYSDLEEIEDGDQSFNTDEDLDVPSINQLPEEDLSGFDNEDDPMEDPIINYLFSPSEDMTNIKTVYSSDEDGGTPQNFSLKAGNNVASGLDWLKTKSSTVNLGSLNPNISKYLNTLPENLRSKLLATSGNDDSHAEGSKHYHNNAVDLRFSPEVYNYIKSDPNASYFGLKVLDPNHGTAPHIHLETKKYGGQLNATTPEQLHKGLNDDSYNTATLHLSGSNVIRGLDSHQPVMVTDGSKYRVLTGPQDTDVFHNKVYETRL